MRKYLPFWGFLAALVSFSPAYSNEAEIIKFNDGIVGKPNYIWIQTQWIYDDPEDLEANKLYLLSVKLETAGFFKSSVVENPPYVEREKYWEGIAAENERNCEKEQEAAKSKKNAFGLPQLVICSGMNRNRLGEERIPRWIVTFEPVDWSKALKSNGTSQMFEIGIIDQVKVISVARSTRSGCDWDAQTRTWFKPQVPPNPIQTALQSVTGRDSLDQDNCYFLDRNGLKWHIANPLLQ